jgi:beta-glucanase (GH16 family)
LDRRKDAREIIVVLREINVKESFANMTVAEIFFHPNWMSEESESNSVIIITHETIPFNFFIFTTCFREFLKAEAFEIHKFLHDSPCEKAHLVPKAKLIFEIPFGKSKSGALFTQFQSKWFLFGFFSEDIIEAKVCETKTFKSFKDLRRLFMCEKLSITTASGGKTSEAFCPGEVVFQDDFDSLDNSSWKHENTLRGGGNWEFQWFVPDTENSFVKDGILHIRPTFTDDKFGKDFVRNSEIYIPPSSCTDSENFGCSRSSWLGIINPIRSASIATINTVAFKYGTVEIRAKIATGDWLVSSISLLPKDPTFYGAWPNSGEINFLEARGNRNLVLDNENIGVEQIGSHFHFGATSKFSHGVYNNKSGFNRDFHVYKLIWTPNNMKSFVDDNLIHHLELSEVGLWKQFNLGETKNPWQSGSFNAPFDKEFFVSISLKVGGVKLFPDTAANYPEKPWKNNEGHGATGFWDERKDWESTWREDDCDFQVDYVKITAS